MTLRLASQSSKITDLTNSPAQGQVPLLEKDAKHMVKEVTTTDTLEVADDKSAQMGPPAQLNLSCLSRVKRVQKQSNKRPRNG